MEKKNKYPVIFVHGMFGFAGDDGLNKVFPYWGMVCGSLMKKLNAEGWECYDPKVSAVGSAWDRACELYAIIKGGQVDYGEAHSKKFDHARFGRTYENPLVADWGQPLSEGGIRKIHMMGHSFGGATMRLLVQLLAEGNEEERAASGSDGTLSPLFQGGHGDMVCSITSLASPHNGTTFFTAFPEFTKGLLGSVFYTANIIGNTKLSRFYDFHLEQFNLTSIPDFPPHYGNLMNLSTPKKLMHSEDQLFYDLTVEGATKLNKTIRCQPDVYYFSFPTCGTKPGPDGTQVKAPIMNPVLAPFGNGIGKFGPKEVDGMFIDESWRPNDGLVPEVSAKHPSDEPFQWWEDAHGNYERGKWYVMDTQVSDHGTIIGGSTSYIGPGRSQPFFDFYHRQLELVNSLD
jgi:triacylglycerol lipase